jgi:hypothetical protein
MKKYNILIILITVYVCTISVHAEKVSHRFIKAGCRAGSVAIIDKNGKVEWEIIEKQETSDAWLLPDGNIIYSYKKGVVERRPDTSVVWEYKAAKDSEIHSCQPIAPGMYVIGESFNAGYSYIYEMDKNKKIHKKIKIPTQENVKKTNKHAQFRQIRKTLEGTYLVTSQTGKGVAREFDSGGNLIRTFKDGRFVAVRLPNGNTLLACGDKHRLIEVDRNDTIVWEVNKEDIPGNILGFVAGIQRLPNGNTVICNWSGHKGSVKGQPQIFEITPDKKVVWEINNQDLGLISCVNILDVQGDMYKFEILR